MDDPKFAANLYTVNPESNTSINNPDPEIPKSKEKSNWDYTSFRILTPLSFVAGLSCVCLVAKWTADNLRGFAWHSNVNQQFNYHPLFMVIGLVFFYGEAILVYRMAGGASKLKLKIAHAVLHGSAFVFSVVALVAVFDYHNLHEPPFPNMYSLHSWIGISAVSLFALQYLIGFLTFLYPTFPVAWRAFALPVHTFLGLVIFVLAIVACLTGLTEKLIYTGAYSSVSISASAAIANSLGIMLILYGLLVVFLATVDKFKRRPLPEENALIPARTPYKIQRTSL